MQFWPVSVATVGCAIGNCGLWVVQLVVMLLANVNCEFGIVGCEFDHCNSIIVPLLVEFLAVAACEFRNCWVVCFVHCGL